MSTKQCENVSCHGHRRADGAEGEGVRPPDGTGTFGPGMDSGSPEALAARRRACCELGKTELGDGLREFGSEEGLMYALRYGMALKLFPAALPSPRMMGASA